MKKLLSYSFLFCFLALRFTASADVSVDSLEKTLKNTSGKKDRFRILTEIATEVIYSDGKKAKAVMKEARTIADELDDNHLYAQYNLLSGRIDESEGKYKEALSKYIEANKLFEKVKDLKGVGQTLNNIGIVHWYLNNYDRAIQYFKEGYQVNKKIGNKQAMSTSLGNMAIIYDEQEKYDEALKIYEEALIIFRELNDEWSVAACYNNMGLNYTARARFSEAEKSFEKALEIHRKVDDKPGIATALNNLGYNKVKTKNFSEAIPYLNESLKISSENNFRYDQKLALLNLASAYEGIGEFRKAYEYHKQYSAVKDSILNEESSKQMSELEVKFSTEKKTLEIKNLKKQQQIVELELERKRKDLELQKLREAEQETQNRINTIILVSIIALVVVSAGLIYWRYRQKKADNVLLHSKNVEISKQKQIIEEKNKDITDSIQYAKTIQDSVLPDDRELKNYFTDSFVLFLPRDIVSGDFYWFTEIDRKIIFTVGDCTGHGVPGSLMSMMGINLLHQIVREEKITDPSKILTVLDKLLAHRFAKESKEMQSKDGMDIAVGVLDKEKNLFSYSSAMRPVYFISAGELKELKNDVFPIGGNYQDKIFKTREVDVKPGDGIYFTSDGYADQFGGEKGKKFLTKRFKELLLAHSSVSMQDQKETLRNEFIRWRGALDQIDDVCILGVRI